MQFGKNLSIPIFIKLFVVIALLLIGTSLFTSQKVASYFENTFEKREQEINLKTANEKINNIDNYFSSLTDKIKFLSATILKTSSHSYTYADDFSLDFDSSIVSLKIYNSLDYKNPIFKLEKEDFLKKYSLGNQFFKKLKTLQHLPFDQIQNGNLKILSATAKQKAPLIWIGLPLTKNKNNQVTQIASVFIRQEVIQPFFTNNGHYEVYLLDEYGFNMGHPKEDIVLSKKSFSDTRSFISAKDSNLRVKQSTETTKSDKYITTYAKSKFGPLLISKIPESAYLKPIYFIRKQSQFILLITLSISILLISLFSNTLTVPIEKLHHFAKLISQGNFDLDIAKNISTKDEVGSLAEALDDMTNGLKEREKIKNVMDKFHGKSVAENMIERELELKGENKDVAIFFSDIRSFTKFSESRTAIQVVEMLNEYMDVMVKCIYKHNGIIDKFVGDAIMAVWGVPHPTENDAQDAVNACIEMRIELEKLNERRIARNEPAIMIGMGLNFGNVISGTVGSEDRMEYTVIGDAVNTAARIEASTKSFGTDLLVSGAVFEKLKDNFVFEKAGATKAKGKSEALVLYKVEGTIVDGQEKLIRTPYSHFEPEEDAGGKTQRVA